MDHVSVLKLLREYSPKSISVGYISYRTGLSPTRIYEILERLQLYGLLIITSNDGEEQVTLIE